MRSFFIVGADPLIEALFKTHTTSIRWSSMIYKVVAINYVRNECGLMCLGEPDKKCQFFVSHDNKCYLGNFDNTEPAAGALSGNHLLYIKYGTSLTLIQILSNVCVY